MLKKFRSYVLLYTALIIYSISTIFAKCAALQSGSIKFFLFFTLEVGFLGLYAIVWQQVLKKFPLVTAMSNKGMVILISLLWSVILFHEKITAANMIGAIVIISGIVMVSSDD